MPKQQLIGAINYWAESLMIIDEFKKLLESLGKLLFFFTTLYVRKEIYDKGYLYSNT